MDIRTITDTYAVAPQIEPSDMDAVAKAGFTAVICNRPDAENPPALQADAMAQAAEGAGLTYTYVPIVGGAMSEENVSEHAAAVARASGPVLAYCASGTRSCVVWAHGMTGRMPIDEIIASAARGGYQLEGLRHQLQARTRRKP